MRVWDYIVKHWFLFLAIFVLLFWRVFRGLFRGRELTPQDDIVKEAEKVEKVGRTLSDVELVSIANALENDLLSGITEDEIDAINQVYKCKNSSDWYSLVSTFGVRKPFGLFRSAVALPTAIQRYMSAEDYKLVSDYVKSIGGQL